MATERYACPRGRGMGSFVQVTKEEFGEFVKNYPIKLEWNVTAICDPPMGSYNDFSDGKVWPESVVAKVHLYDDDPHWRGSKPEYYILKR